MTGIKQVKTRLVVFDLYGTLIKFGITHHPFRKILKFSHSQGRKPQDNDARILMTRNDNPQEIFRSMGIAAPEELLQTFHDEIQEELNSLTLFDDVIPTLKQLTAAKIELAICSNLAKPYGEIIDRLLPDYSFTRVLSYEVGFIKPDCEIYDSILKRTGHQKENVLFIGDTYIADYEGPINFGMQALHLSPGGATQPDQINSLTDALAVIDRNNL